MDLEQVMHELMAMRCISDVPGPPVAGQHMQEVIVQQLPHALHLLGEAVPVVVPAPGPVLSEKF